MRTENTAAEKITAIFDDSPMPSHRIKSGIRPSFGIGFVKEMKKFQKLSHFGDHPIRMPKVVPKTSAKANPVRQRNKLAAMSVSSWPFTAFVQIVSRTVD